MGSDGTVRIESSFELGPEFRAKLEELQQRPEFEEAVRTVCERLSEDLDSRLSLALRYGLAHASPRPSAPLPWLFRLDVS